MTHSQWILELFRIHDLLKMKPKTQKTKKNWKNHVNLIRRKGLTSPRPLSWTLLIFFNAVIVPLEQVQGTGRTQSTRNRRFTSVQTVNKTSVFWRDPKEHFRKGQDYRWSEQTYQWKGPFVQNQRIHPHLEERDGKYLTVNSIPTITYESPTKISSPVLGEFRSQTHE